MPTLRVTFRQSGFAGRVLQLDQPVLRLGREPVCEVLFDENADRVVSRIHAELRWDGPRLRLFPNGERLVYVRGVRAIPGTELTPGDLVELAGVGGPAIEVHWQAVADATEAATQADLPVVKVPSAEERTPPLGSAPVYDNSKTPVESDALPHDAPTFRLAPEQAAALGVPREVPVPPPSKPPAPATAGLETAMQGGTAVLSLEQLRAAAAASGPSVPPPLAQPAPAVALQQLPVAAPNLGPKNLDLPTSVISIPTMPEARTVPEIAPIPPAQRGPYVSAATAVPQMVPKEVAEAATSMLRIQAPPAAQPALRTAAASPEDATANRRLQTHAPPPQPSAPAASPTGPAPGVVAPSEDDLATSMLRVKLDDADAPTPPSGMPAVRAVSTVPTPVVSPPPIAVALPVGAPRVAASEDDQATSMLRVKLEADPDAPTPPSGLAPVSVASLPPPPKPASSASAPPSVSAAPPAPVTDPSKAEPPKAAKPAVPFGTKLSSQPPPEVVAAAAKLAEQAKSLPKPSLAAAVVPEHASTMMMPALNAEASTQFIRIDELPKPVPPAKKTAQLAAIAGAVTLLLLGGVWLGWSKLDQSRRAEVRAQRIESLRVELEALAKAGKSNAPEYAELEAEIQREEKALEADTGVKPKPRPKPRIDEDAALAAALARQQAEDAAAEAKAQTKVAAARELWVNVKLKELDGLPRPKAQRMLVWEERKAAKAEYDAFVAKELPSAKSDPLIREAAQAFGESGATAPERFLAEVRAELKTLTEDPVEREMFIAAVEGGEANAYSPAITTALADQGLPVELYYLGYVLSHLDPKSSGAADPKGIAKGMFRLLPGPAKTIGLTLGPKVDQPDYDPADERHMHEKESKLVARLMRDVHRHGAAGSVLLVVAAFDGGETGALGGMKSRAGIETSSKDPAQVSYWKLYEAGAIPAARRAIVARTVAAAVAGMHPDKVGLPFKAPFRHVEIDER